MFNLRPYHCESGPLVPCHITAWSHMIEENNAKGTHLLTEVHTHTIRNLQKHDERNFYVLMQVIKTKLVSYGTNEPGWERYLYHGVFLKCSSLCVTKMVLLLRLACCSRSQKPVQSKTVVQISQPHLDDQVEAFQVGVFQEYEI